MMFSVHGEALKQKYRLITEFLSLLLTVIICARSLSCRTSNYRYVDKGRLKDLFFLVLRHMYRQ